MTPSLALASLLIIAPPSAGLSPARTSSAAVEWCTPAACRMHRASAIKLQGKVDTANVRIRALASELDDKRRTIEQLEFERSIVPQTPACGEHVCPAPAWEGWPYVIAGGLVAVFAFGVVVGVRAADASAPAAEGGAP